MSGRMQGKICLVTGATAGIGKATALGLARLDARVVIVGRDAGLTEETVKELRRESRNSQVESLVADLSSQAEVRRLAAAFQQRYDKLDVLINNAGVLLTTRETTVDGFERTWAVNYLAKVLLTLELLDCIKASRPARIVNVSSKTHFGRTLDLNNLQGEKGVGMSSYAQTMLSTILFSYALARRLEGAGVTVNCLHPGVVSTRLMKFTGVKKILMEIVRPVLLSPEQGAATSIYLSTSDQVEGVTGKYFDKCKAVRSSDVTYDETLQEQLWRLSLRQLQLTDVGPAPAQIVATQ